MHNYQIMHPNLASNLPCANCKKRQAVLRFRYIHLLNAVRSMLHYIPRQHAACRPQDIFYYRLSDQCWTTISSVINSVTVVIIS